MNWWMQSPSKELPPCSIHVIHCLDTSGNHWLLLSQSPFSTPIIFFWISRSDSKWDSFKETLWWKGYKPQGAKSSKNSGFPNVGTCFMARNHFNEGSVWEGTLWWYKIHLSIQRFCLLDKCTTSNVPYQEGWMLGWLFCRNKFIMDDSSDIKQQISMDLASNLDMCTTFGLGNHRLHKLQTLPLHF